MFFIGSIALFIASLGFWQLKEQVPSRMLVNNMGHFRSLMKMNSAVISGWVITLTWSYHGHKHYSIAFCNALCQGTFPNTES